MVCPHRANPEPSGPHSLQGRVYLLQQKLFVASNRNFGVQSLNVLVGRMRGHARYVARLHHVLAEGFFGHFDLPQQPFTDIEQTRLEIGSFFFLHEIIP